MSNLENIIRSNRSAFDEEEPAAGHEDRFLARLSRLRPRKATISTEMILRLTAVVVLALLTTLWLFDKYTGKKPVGLGAVSPEYREVEIYYTSLVNSKVEELNKTGVLNDVYPKNMLMDEIAEMDAVYDSLRKELIKYPNDERIIDAMIVHYETKVEILTRLLDLLKNLQTEQYQNNTGHGNT